MKTTALLIVLLFSVPVFSQGFKFAFLSDTHIGVPRANEDLERTVADINEDTSLKFVIITGDITELGTDDEMLLAKQILSRLKKPLYIQTGNHDGNWSPSGGRIFNALFGPGRFAFQYDGYLFIGTNSGPFMHHKAPGEVPREDIVWMDSVLNHQRGKNIAIVYTNHYPQDSSQRNWFEAMDRLKKKNLQLILVGHGHINTRLVFEGVPGVMGRSNLRAIDSVSGYNIVTFSDGHATFEEKRPVTQTIHQWAAADLFQHEFGKDTNRYSRPSYAINALFRNVRSSWLFEDTFGVGAGLAYSNHLVLVTNTGGMIYGLDENNGNRKWVFHTGGKIYSTPTVVSNRVVFASTDSNVYCLDASDGKLFWKYKAPKPIVSSPVIANDVVYIGSSDGNFRAIELLNGRLNWDYNGVKDFVITKPLAYAGQVYFGSWGNEFYALNASTGTLTWKWIDTSGNRMFSPAGCRPVAAKGKLFIVAPDQYMTAFEASSGKVMWRTKSSSVRVRESMGLSADSSIVYVKTTDGRLCGISTSGDEMKVVFSLNLQLGYDICAFPIVERDGIIYVASNFGIVVAVQSATHKLLWKHKISNSNITSILPLEKHLVIVSSEDGKINCLQTNLF
jgi:outer membrane protein assembly factor BamB/predicted phosphodiesterase